MKNASFWKGKTIRETFDQWWSEAPATGCHEWQRSLTPQGYGQLNVGGRPMLAHRFAWERVNGPIPQGLHVLHACDNRRCVNVSHLSLGTNLDNIQDTVRKGRNRGPWNRERVWPERAPRRLKVAETFDKHWILDAQSGCWIWQLFLNDDGYGKVSSNGKKTSAHRFSYERVHGPIPVGSVVLHTCDNPACVNPEHLVIGTQRDNIRDMVEKGRQRGAVGERNKKAKLKPEDVVEIRRRLSLGETRVSIASDYRVGPSQISHIALDKCWKQQEVSCLVH